MVRVLLCHYFKEQRVFSESYQPTSLYASRQFLFIGVGSCRVFVHSLEQPNFPLVCQFPTISTAVKLVSSEAGNYVAAIERRQQRNASAYARVYFNWERASKNEAVRVVVAGYSVYQRNPDFSQQLLAVELPCKTSVTALACCKSTGNVIVACDGKLCVYRLCSSTSTNPEMEQGVFQSHDLEHLLDIDPGFVVRGIDICGHFVAFRSKLEVRAIKLVFSQHSASPICKGSNISGTGGTPDRDRNKYSSTECSLAVNNENCMLWEFDGAMAAFPKPQLNQKPRPLPSDEILFHGIRTEPVYTDTYLEPKEVLGPVTEVKGHPLKVIFAGLFGVGISVGNCVTNVHGVTMLYRRFRTEQLCNSDSGIGALHSLQLLPTYAKGLPPPAEALDSPLVPYNGNQALLCGMCVMVSGPKEGFMYDIFTNTKLISQYEYTCDTMKVSACHTLLHAITKQGLETYTVRMYAAASKAIRQDVTLDQRLKTWHSSSSSTNEGPKLVREEERQKVLNKDDGQELGAAAAAPDPTMNKLEASTNESDIDTYSSGDSDVTLSSEKSSLKSTTEENISQGSLNNSESAHDSKIVAKRKGSSVSRASHQGLGPLESKPFFDDDSELNSPHRIRASAMQTSSGREWELQRPTHELHCLQQLCPSPSLDICLIGMYPFVGLAYLMCSDETVVLYTRASLDNADAARHRASIRSPNPTSGMTQPEWTVYVLQSREPMQLYKAVMPLANRCQKHNPQAYHHLVCEQHMFLKSCCLVETDGIREETRRKKINKLLCESALNLADICSKSRKGEGASAAEYYTMSGLPFSDVISRVWKAGPPYGEGMAHYLDQKLFGPDKSVTVSENTAKKIFRIYSKVKPSRVPEIVLTSSLSGFSPETAIGALEDLKKTEDKLYRFTALDKLVLAILYLHQCEPDHAQAELFSIQETQLVKTVSANFFLLHDDLKHLTPLAQMLRKHKPGVFLSIILHLHDSKKLPLDTILTLLGASKPDAHLNSQVLDFLEAVVNDRKRTESFQAVVGLLTRIYMSCIIDNSKNTKQMMAAQRTHNHVPEGDGHFGLRYPWLNKLPPFSGSPPCPHQECPIYRHSSAQSSVRTTRHTARTVPSIHHTATRMFTRSSPSLPFSGAHQSQGSGPGEDCSCCCCTEFLLKLQSLLSSTFVGSSLCETLLADIEDRDFKGDLSVKLLCYPHVGMHKKGIALLLEKWPSVIIPYGQQFFGADVEKWSYLLTVLLEQFQKPLKDEIHSNISKESRKALLGVLKGTLSRLAELTSPLTLLSLIPDEGALGFFLPYLEQCYRRCASQKLSSKLTTGNVTTQARFYT